MIQILDYQLENVILPVHVIKKFWFALILFLLHFVMYFLKVRLVEN